MSKATILSIGSVNVDFQVRTPRWPEPSETLVVRDYLRIGGGKAFNRAWLARHLGAKAHLVACVGDDDLAEQALRTLHAEGVEVSNVRRVPGQATGVSLIATREEDGDKAILLAPNANMAWVDEDIRTVETVIDEASEGSILTVDAEVPEEVVHAAVRRAKARGLAVLLDPSPADRVDDVMLRHADFVTPNESEAKKLTGIAVGSVAQAERAGRVLVDRGVGTAIVKLGGEGVVLVRDHETRCIPALTVEVVDTTGAGDALAGSLAYALLEGRDVEAATRFAVVASSLSVTGYGSHPSYPDRSRVEEGLSRAP